MNVLNEQVILTHARTNTHTHAHTHTLTHTHTCTHTCVHMQHGNLQQEVTDISENVKPAKIWLSLCVWKGLQGIPFFLPSCSRAFNTWTCMYTRVFVLFFVVLWVVFLCVCVCVCIFLLLAQVILFNNIHLIQISHSSWQLNMQFSDCSLETSILCNYWRCWILFIRVILPVLKILDFLKSTILRSFRDHHRHAQSYWVRESFPEQHNLEEMVMETVSSRWVFVLSCETVTLKRCSRRLASRWVFVLAVWSWTVMETSQQVFVLSSVILNSHGD